MKRLFSAIAVLAIVSGAVAFKTSTRFASGSVFCTSSCVAGAQVAFKVDPAGSITKPCGPTTQPYILDEASICTATVNFNQTNPTKFTGTTDQGK